MTPKFPGIRPGTYAEKAISIVANLKSVTGPQLAAYLGVSTYEMGVVRTAIAVKYITKAKKEKDGRINLFTVGPTLIQHIARRGMPEMIKGVPESLVPYDAQEIEELNIVPPRTPFAFRPLNLSRLPVAPGRG